MDRPLEPNEPPAAVTEPAVLREATVAAPALEILAPVMAPALLNPEEPMTTDTELSAPVAVK